MEYPFDDEEGRRDQSSHMDALSELSAIKDSIIEVCNHVKIDP